jgi:tetratricopeptide (TPR) repeat protein
MHIYFVFVLLLLVFPQCARRRNEGLASQYYKMSLLELSPGCSNKASYRKSLKYVDQALDNEENPRYLAHKATLLFLLGDEVASSAAFDLALKRADGPAMKAELSNNYACLLANRGKRSEALAIFKRLEGDKYYVTPEVALVNQAKIYCDRGDYELAKRKLERAIESASEYVDAHYYLGLVCFMLKDFGSASNHVDRVLQFEPSHVGAKRLLQRIQAL